MDKHNQSPLDQIPALRETDTFEFACHSGVSCFTRCCRDTDMYLYPYDIIRLKTKLGLTSEEFINRHTVVAIRDNPSFPHVMLKMSDAEDKACPFLTDDGCSVYEDRPFSCRAYPLERAVARYGESDDREIRYFIARHPYCKGHSEKRMWTVQEWMNNQKLEAFNAMNDLWVDIDTIFRNNPWGDHGLESPSLKMAFMACFNVDKLRNFVFNSSFLTRFNVDNERLERLQTDDAALMIFGFDWVRFFLTGKGSLSEKNQRT
jgi:Fe-S-cluster containining protein